jgi:putative ABC transport system permease protein
MKLKNHFIRSFHSLALHGLRSLLSTLGILFGVAAVVAMLSIGEGAKRETLEQIEQLGIHTLIIKQNLLSEGQKQQARENRSSGLTEADASMIQKRLPNLLYIAPTKVLKASLTGSLQTIAPELMAVTKAYRDIKPLKLKEGRFICDQDCLNKNLVCVLGGEIAKALGSESALGKTIRIESSLFKIIGILQFNQWKESKNSFLATKNMNQIIFIPLGSENILRSYLHPENDLLAEIILKINPNQDFSFTVKFIKNLLKYSHRDYQDYQVIVPQELLNQANQTQKMFNYVLGSIAAISLLVGGIGIMNMMLANVSERIREIGIRRALGATKFDILMQFLAEALLLTLFGAFLGIVLGISFSFIISYLADWTTVVTTWSLILSFGMASFIGICSGLYPAYRASNLDPIVALRHE